MKQCTKYALITKITVHEGSISHYSRVSARIEKIRAMVKKL
jgi:hypothetical protein